MCADSAENWNWKPTRLAQRRQHSTGLATRLDSTRTHRDAALWRRDTLPPGARHRRPVDAHHEDAGCDGEEGGTQDHQHPRLKFPQSPNKSADLSRLVFSSFSPAPPPLSLSLSLQSQRPNKINPSSILRHPTPRGRCWLGTSPTCASCPRRRWRS
jgi:hypothetical protein